MALHFGARAFHPQIFGRQIEALAALEADGERLLVLVQAQFGRPGFHVCAWRCLSARVAQFTNRTAPAVDKIVAAHFLARAASASERMKAQQAPAAAGGNSRAGASADRTAPRRSARNRARRRWRPRAWRCRCRRGRRGSPGRCRGRSGKPARPCSSSSVALARCKQGQQQQLRAGAFRPHARCARACAITSSIVADLQRIARRHQEALLAAAEADHHRVLHVAALASAPRHWRRRRDRRAHADAWRRRSPRRR